MRVQNAESPEFISMVRELFVEYSKSLGIDLCFQGFAEELANLPGEYVKPAGRLSLLMDDDRAAGCGALRPIDRAVCEMKRVYVRPAFRGRGAGRAIILSMIEAAREIGYQQMRLDTLPTMAEAIAIYRSLGFREIAAYRTNPVRGALFLELDLTRSTPGK